MSITIDPGWALAVFYVALRLGVLLLLSPVFSSLGSLSTVRVLLTLALAALLVQGMALRVPPTAFGSGAVLAGVCGEVLTGAVLAFGVFAAFGACSLAGAVLDVQSGFGLGTVYDPVTRAGAPLFASMLNMAAVVVFFGLDAHHALLRGLAYSLRQVAPGAGLAALPLDAVVRQFGLMFSLGLAVVAPVLLCLVLVEVGLAVVARVLPQMNVVMVVVPAKLAAALALFGVTVATLGPVMGRVFATIFTFWEQVLG